MTDREEELMKVLEDINKPSDTKIVGPSLTQQAYNIICNMNKMELLFIKKAVDSKLDNIDNKPKIVNISDLEKFYGDDTSNSGNDLV